MHSPFLVSTDLDGTLLDHHHYDLAPALPAIQALREAQIPILFNTSKTFAESRALQRRIDLSGPLIVENGSALLIPENDALMALVTDDFEFQDGWWLRSFGCPRDSLLTFIRQQRAQLGHCLEGFADWDTATLAAKTGLDTDSARLASTKRYSEPFVWLGDTSTWSAFQQAAEAQGWRLLKGGRFFHLQGDTTKATPLLWLRKHWPSKRPPTLICLGDNHNDIAMLNIADIPVCIKSPAGDFPPLDTDKPVIYSEKYGPEGWRAAIEKILQSQMPG